VRYVLAVSNATNPSAHHEARLSALGSEHAALERRANAISLVRLLMFFAAAALLVAGLQQALSYALLLAFVCGLLFFAAVAWHARVIAKRGAVEVRMAVHRRYLQRIAGSFDDLPSDGRGLLPPDHPYASDIDLLGPGSLFQRIDVSQTREGERALANALGSPAPIELARARQRAVAELDERRAFCEELEAQGALHQRNGKLDHAPFMALFKLPSLFAEKSWLKPLALTLLAVTLTLIVLNQLDIVPGLAVWAAVLVQGVLLWSVRQPVHHALNMLTARLGSAQAYEAMLCLFEAEEVRAPHLVALREKLVSGGVSASRHMARLARYEGFAQLRTQGPLYIVLNLVTMWDLFVLERIEHFAREVGPHCDAWFEVIAELELLASLATLMHVDRAASFPELDDHRAHVRAEGLLHPLLPALQRVENDVELTGAGSALIITGSNMAGKSTLLRALGLNCALALAGGPVCARKFVLPPVRLRASIRIDDSLQRGASYFHAELTRLRMVVGELDRGAPVLFLLDELLRGTNAHARHQGARAVLLHLLERGAMGLVATHDVALSELEQELPGRVRNVHFTDVFQGGEMRFDYKLRDGVVRTSNALRLLAMAGIEVPASDAVA
jgi:hypothetical protein